MLPRRFSLITVAALAVAAPAAAQSAAIDAEPSSAAFAPAAFAPAAAQDGAEAPRAVAGAPSAPALGAAAAGLQPARQSAAPLAQEEAAVEVRARASYSQSQVLMIVGGAALITGLIIGDDPGQLLAIGGAGVGLFGLYRYLQGR